MADLHFFGGKTLGYVKTIKYSDRIYDVELTGSDKLVILNVYLPYDNNTFEPLDNVRQILGEISAISRWCILLLTMLYKYVMAYYVYTGLVLSPVLAKHMVLCRDLIT